MVLTLLLAFLFFQPAQAPTQKADAPKPHALTELEQKQVSEAATAEQQAIAEFQQRGNDVIAAPLAQAVEVKHYFEVANLRLQLAQVNRKLVLETLRSKYLCPNCTLSADSKFLVRPEKE